MIPEYIDAVAALNRRAERRDLRRVGRDRFTPRSGPRLRGHQAPPRQSTTAPNWRAAAPHPGDERTHRIARFRSSPPHCHRSDERTAPDSEVSLIASSRHGHRHDCTPDRRARRAGRRCRGARTWRRPAGCTHRDVERGHRAHGGRLRHQRTRTRSQRRRRAPRWTRGRIDRHRQRRRLEHRQHPARARHGGSRRWRAVRCTTHRAPRRPDHDRRLGAGADLRAEREPRSDRGVGAAVTPRGVSHLDGDHRNTRVGTGDRHRIRRSPRSRIAGDKRRCSPTSASSSSDWRCSCSARKPWSVPPATSPPTSVSATS